MPFRLDQPTLAGGEIGAELQSRFDTAKYRTALRKARNVLIRPGGGIQRRPGMIFVGEQYNSAKVSRPIPFQFSLTQSYVLEFGDLTMRVISDGGYVLRPELIVTAITKAAHASVTAPANGYVVGDDVVFSNITGMVEINGLQARILSLTDANTFVINLDTTAFSTFIGSGGGVAGAGAGGVEGDPVAGPDTTTPPSFVDIEPIPSTYEYPPLGFNNL